MSDETVPVDIRLLAIERTNIGKVRAYAVVEIEIAGVCLIVEGITVTHDRGEISADLPAWRRDGRKYPDIGLPAEIYEPIGRLVLEAYREMLGPAASARGPCILQLCGDQA